MASGATTEPRHTLHIVSGKGGTGKTTIAAALACALATTGRRVLVCEVEGRHGIADLFGRPPCRRRRGAADQPHSDRRRRARAGHRRRGRAAGVPGHLLPPRVRREGPRQVRRDRLRHLDRARAARRAADRQGVRGGPPPGARAADDAYDAVVLDAPPTGRIAQFLNVHEAVSGLAKVGPIRNQADSIMRMLRAGHHRGAPGHPAGGHAGDRDRGGDRGSWSRPRSGSAR